MPKITKETKAAVLETVKELRKNMKYEPIDGNFTNYGAAALKAAELREQGKIARAARKIVYYVEVKPRVLH